MMEDKTTITTISIDSYTAVCNAAMDYMHTFINEDPLVQQNFILKREHIHRVVGYTEVISRSLECDEPTVLAAQLAALLHDIGRFVQFEKYQTFNDAISEDHAEIALGIIEEKKWLANLPEEMQISITKAISYHNKLIIPKGENQLTLLLSQILRDADKLDIFELAIKEYSLQNKNKNASFFLDLQVSSTVSKAIAKSIMAEKLPNKADLTTITDFKLLQMAYVFDINFRESFSIVNKKGFLKQLFETMPKTDQIFELYRKAKIHVENQLI
ncbi:MAG: HD domain-containing protein [Prolixibacteraceae bacterium]